MEDNATRQHGSDCEGDLEFVQRRSIVDEWNEAIWGFQALSCYDDVRFFLKIPY